MTICQDLQGAGGSPTAANYGWRELQLSLVISPKTPDSQCRQIASGAKLAAKTQEMDRTERRPIRSPDPGQGGPNGSGCRHAATSLLASAAR
jgi:hypothetical protein